MNEIATTVVELSKLLLSGYFAYARQKGMTEEEINRSFVEAKTDFEKNNPADLPDAG